ncbi:MAG TPA: hypothetical protein PJ982_19445, partial [Lacipirellulaceae bacterium]|nr:hypothetical protein [Lacipirellulaceae bacterium]
MINAPIGSSVAAPAVHLVGQQIAVRERTWGEFITSDAWGEALSEGIAYAQFQFQAPLGQQNDPFLFAGFIHVAAGGVVTATGDSVADMTTQVGWPLTSVPNESTINGIRIWLGTTLLAEVYYDGWGHASASTPSDTGQWTVWGQYQIDGQYHSFSQSGSGAQALIPWAAQISHGDIVTFDADPNRNPLGTADFGGIGGSAIAGSAENPWQQESSSANIFEHIAAWGAAWPLADPPEFIEEELIDTDDDGNFGPPLGIFGDLNGDGVTDRADLDLWIEIQFELAQRGMDYNGIPLAPLIVTTGADVVDANDGELSLREALALAASPAYAGHDYIVFSPWIDEVLIDGAQLVVSSDLTIVGRGADKLTIDAQGLSRAFSVNAGIEATIRGLTITDGVALDGGAIFNWGDLTLDAVALIGNEATNAGGAVASRSQTTSPASLTILNSTIDNNSGRYGAAINVDGPGNALVIDSSTISNNTWTDGVN